MEDPKRDHDSENHPYGIGVVRELSAQFVELKSVFGPRCGGVSRAMTTEMKPEAS